MANRDAVSTAIASLADGGIQRGTNKRLGQHFLVDRNIARKIVGLAGIEAGDWVLEIGPGSGALTRFIVGTPHVWYGTLERDSYWAFATSHEHPGISMVVIDALTFGWERLAQGRSWKLLGNLPYNIASRLIWEIFPRASGLTLAVLMVQKEVGDRLVARPGSKDYGALSVWVQSFVMPRSAFGVSPQAFRPRPKVDSTVLSFTPLPAAARPADPTRLAGLLSLCFRFRRKQLHTILRDWWEEELEAQLAAFGYGLRSRPEELSVDAFKFLSQAILGHFPY